MTQPQSKPISWSRSFKRYKVRYLMLVPALLCTIIFVFGPVWGMSIAFFEYNPGLGLLKSPFVGFKYFQRFFTTSNFGLILRNSFMISFLNIVFNTIFPISFAALLNELVSMRFKKTVQTISYLPHFISYIVVANIATTMLAPSGVAMSTLVKLGILDRPVLIMSQPKTFWVLVASLNIWKEMGWSAIIYISAIAGIDPQLYEAAMVDGAGRFRRIWHITLTGIRPTIIVLLIMAMPDLMNAGFDPSFLLGNAMVSDYSEVLETFVYELGLKQGQYSMATAVGICQMVLSIVLITSANAFARRVSDYSIY